MSAIVLYSIARTQYFLAFYAKNKPMADFWYANMRAAGSKLDRDGR